MESETLKILGTDGGRQPHAAVVSAHTNRVPVVDGHTMTVSVDFSSKPSMGDISAALAAFKGKPQDLGLPSAPNPAIVVMTLENRPQPRLDVDLGDGMTVSVGRLRVCPVLQAKYVALGHNTVRGAAGAAILNGELIVAEGLA
jgi:aspartate-semialdehyde dehydrogenase